MTWRVFEVVEGLFGSSRAMRDATATLKIGEDSAGSPVSVSIGQSPASRVLLYFTPSRRSMVDKKKEQLRIPCNWCSGINSETQPKVEVVRSPCSSPNSSFGSLSSTDHSWSSP